MIPKIFSVIGEGLVLHILSVFSPLKAGGLFVDDHGITVHVMTERCKEFCHTHDHEGRASAVSAKIDDDVLVTGFLQGQNLLSQFIRHLGIIRAVVGFQIIRHGIDPKQHGIGGEFSPAEVAFQDTFIDLFHGGSQTGQISSESGGRHTLFIPVLIQKGDGDRFSSDPGRVHGAEETVIFQIRTVGHDDFHFSHHLFHALSVPGGDDTAVSQARIPKGQPIFLYAFRKVVFRIRIVLAGFQDAHAALASFHVGRKKSSVRAADEGQAVIISHEFQKISNHPRIRFVEESDMTVVELFRELHPVFLVQHTVVLCLSLRKLRVIGRIQLIPVDSLFLGQHVMLLHNRKTVLKALQIIRSPISGGEHAKTEGDQDQSGGNDRQNPLGENLCDEQASDHKDCSEVSQHKAPFPRHTGGAQHRH